MRPQHVAQGLLEATARASRDRTYCHQCCFCLPSAVLKSASRRQTYGIRSVFFWTPNGCRAYGYLAQRSHRRYDNTLYLTSPSTTNSSSRCGRYSSNNDGPWWEDLFLVQRLRQHYVSDNINTLQKKRRGPYHDR